MQPKFSRRIVQKKAPVWIRKQTAVCCPDCNQGYLIVEQRQKRGVKPNGTVLYVKR